MNELRVFISSTNDDLEEYRKKVEETLIAMNTSIMSMRFFGSKEGEPINTCLEKLSKCNYYICIIGHRYGSIPDKYDKSCTHIEYEKAIDMKIPRRIYFMGEHVGILPKFIEDDNKRKKLGEFQDLLKKENTKGDFSNPDDLARLVAIDVKNYIGDLEEKTKLIDTGMIGKATINEMSEDKKDSVQDKLFEIKIKDIKNKINNGDLNSATKEIEDLLKYGE